MIPGFASIHRMIFWELLRVFLLSLVGLTGLFLIGGVIQQAGQLGLGPGKLLSVIPLLIPSSLPYTIPATVLFASCVAYGRLSNDNEVVALKAAGIDILTVIKPALLLGLFGAAAVAGASWSLIPRTQVQLQEEIARDPKEFMYAQLRRERSFRTPTSPYALYVKDVQGERLVDVVIKRRKPTQKIVPGIGVHADYDYVARAREARLIVDVDNRTLSVDADKWVGGSPGSSLESTGSSPMVIELPELFSLKELKSRPNSMDWDRIPDRVAELKGVVAEIAERRAVMRRAAEGKGAVTDPAVLFQIGQQDASFQSQLDGADRNVRNAEFEYHVRPALAASCLVFALVGCPVGIWFNRSDYLSTFVVCWIPTVMAYYPLLFMGGGLAKDGRVPILVGVWLANTVVGAMALVLTGRLMKR